MDIKPNITVFFPVYNDERTVRQVAEKAIRVCKEISNLYEVIIVNDCSPDRSGEIADQLAIEYAPNIKVVHHTANKGYGGALKSGFGASQYEWICFTDGDDEYDLEDLYKLIKLKNYYDLIITFRYKKAYSSIRIFISNAYNLILRYIFKTTYRDISTGLRLIKKEILQDLKLTSNSPFIGAELTIKTMLKGLRVGEVGIQTFPREFGSGSATSLKNIYLTIKDMLRVYNEIFSDNYEIPANRKRK
jgi:glycosyltransferase involved in cell wall biosynthesis